MSSIDFTANEAVAFNLRRARELHGWTQEQAAERLEPYLGTRWSKASFSAAERSVAGKRVKQFSADEIAAFSRAFEVPIEWFFTAPRSPEDLEKLLEQNLAALRKRAQEEGRDSLPGEIDLATRAGGITELLRAKRVTQLLSEVGRDVEREVGESAERLIRVKRPAITRARATARGKERQP